MSDHIVDAAGLAALPERDPERISAYEHAAGCPPCAKALREGERLMALLDRAPPLPAPSEAAMRRAWNTVVAEIDADERERAAGGAVRVSAARRGSGAQKRSRGGPHEVPLNQSGGVEPPRKKAVVPQRREGFWAAAAVVFSALFVFLDGHGGGLSWAVGVECLFIELGTAAVAVGGAAFIVENKAGFGRGAAWSALAAWSAVVAQVYLHFRCPAAHALPHLLAFHLLGVVLAAVFGGALGSKLRRGTA